MFQKPQAHDAGAANGADASSPFQQMLSSAATTTPVTDQSGQNAPNSGKKAGKDSKSDSKSGQAQQSAGSQTIADPSTLIQAGAVNDASQANAGQTNSGSGDTTAQTNDPSVAQASPTAPQTVSAPQTAPDVNQSLAVAQLPVSSGGNTSKPDSTSVKTSADTAGDPLAALLASDAQKSTAAAQNASASGNDNTSSTSASPSDSSNTASGSTSQPSKPTEVKGNDQTAAAVQLQTTDANAPVNAAAQPAAPAQPSPPAAKKDHKSDKTRDPNNSDAGNNQATPATAVVTAPAPAPATVVATAPLIVVATPAPASTDSTTSANGIDAIATAQTGQSESAAKNSQTTTNPPDGGKIPAPSNQASGDAAKSDSSTQTSPGGPPAAAQNNTAALGGNAAQSADAKAAATSNDKNGQQTNAVPVQPQAAQVSQQPSQLQAATPPIPPTAPSQAHAAPTAAVAQNVQVSQSDPGANTNTFSALAVAIAAKSQSGNKQFDIRLDPPELGRVEVRLSIDATGKAQASLSADQPRTLDLLKADSSTLTRALRDAGLNVSQNGLNFSLRGQNQQNGGNGFTPRSGRVSQISLIATSAIGSVPGGANYQGPADGRLDIRV